MHRALIRRALGGLLVLGLAACGAPPAALREASRVDRLRAQITKAQNAIAETNGALARARGTPYLAELEVRLAELLSEEARYHFQVAQERESRASGRGERSLHVPQVRLLKDRAVELYEAVLQREPASPLAPRVLFNLGQEHRELGDYAAMRATLGRLVDEHPAHPLAAEALLVLGDDAFDRGEMKAAAQAWQRIVDAPPSRASGLAWYKLGWVRVNEGDCKRALDAFTRAIAAADGDPAPGQAVDVRREALVDLTWCLSREVPPDQAVPFVRQLAADRGAYVAALARLGDRFSLMDQAVGALAVGRELLRLGPDGPARLDDARTVHAALRKTEAYDQIGDDVRLIVQAVRRQVRRPGQAPEARARLLEEFEKYGRDLATRAQARMRRPGALARPGSPSPAQVAAAYEAWLEAFPDDANRLAVLQNLAVVRAEGGDPLGSARRSLEVGLALAPGAERTQALYDAVVQYQAALGPDGKQSALERVLGRAGLRRAASALLAGTLPADQARRVQFAIGQTDYDEGHLQAAIDRLTAVAFSAPGTAEGDAAVRLVLDAHKRREDWLGFIGSGRRFLAADSPVTPPMKAWLGPVVAAAEQRQLDDLSLAAAGVDGADVAAELQKFAARYQGTSLGERALISAFMAARAEGDAEALYRMAGDIQQRYPTSPQLAGVLGTAARTAAARFDVERAIPWFQQAAAADPDRQPTLRLAEGRLRAAVADGPGALAAFRQGLAAAGAGPGPLPAALAEALEATTPPAAVAQQLAPLAGTGDAEVLARLGLAQVRLGRGDEGEATLQQVLNLGATASEGARARAWYGQAEALAATLAGYQPQGDVESLTELVTLIEVTEQAYLKAARQVDPIFTAAALGRLAYLSKEGARRLRALPPAVVAAAGAQDALARRVKVLEKSATDALAACSELAWTRQLFNPAVRACLRGEPPATDPAMVDALAARRPATSGPALDAARARLGQQPDDVAALRALGEALLGAGDAHVARLALARAVQAGGGPEEANLLGLACHQAGDQTGALEAFARAAVGGLEAGRQNLATALRGLGLAAAADTALARWPAGRGGGRLIGAAP